MHIELHPTISSELPPTVGAVIIAERGSCPGADAYYDEDASDLLYDVVDAAIIDTVRERHGSSATR